MKSILKPLEELQQFEVIQKSIKEQKMPVQVTGCQESQKSHLMAALGENYLYKVVIAENELKAKEIYEDLNCTTKMYICIRRKMRFFIMRM